MGVVSAAGGRETISRPPTRHEDRRSPLSLGPLGGCATIQLKGDRRQSMHGNETRNQHFVPRVEQKLNASNPGSTGGKFRIYSFRIMDREAYRIQLEAPGGRAIASTLSMLDLFSFDVPGGGPLRMNLEALFHKYEANVEIHTKGLLEKLAAGSAD